MKELYQVTFGDQDVVVKFGSGNIQTQSEFFNSRISLQSTRWKHDYPFAAFKIMHRDTDRVAGYEIMGNGYDVLAKSSMPNTAEASYVIGKQFQNSNLQKENTVGLSYTGVGSETVGALFLYYGQELFDSRAVVNQSLDTDTNKFVGGTNFEKILATSRIDNPRSTVILENCGFIQKGEPELKGNFLRFTHIKDFAYEENCLLLNQPEGETSVVGDTNNDF